ncbi:hypothetical protein LTS18_000127, partial [Coniosporium uncinatum]
MSSYLASLRQSISQIVPIATLTNCFEHIGLLAYRDYCDGKSPLEWSGWLSPAANQKQPDATKKASELRTTGGGDAPEATKTALAKAYEVMRSDAKTVILLYTDAAPHTMANGGSTYSNHGLEQCALKDRKSYSGFGPSFANWV